MRSMFRYDFAIEQKASRMKVREAFCFSFNPRPRIGREDGNTWRAARGYNLEGELVAFRIDFVDLLIEGAFLKNHQIAIHKPCGLNMRRATTCALGKQSLIYRPHPVWLETPNEDSRITTQVLLR